MQYKFPVALAIGATLLAGVGASLATPHKSHSSSGVSAAAADRPPAEHRGRQRGARFLHQFDVNHDGKVTRGELASVLATQFKDAGGSAKGLNESQYAAVPLAKLRQRSDRTFRRADGNGDGKLSQQEFMASEAQYFTHRDHDGTGRIPCSRRRSSGGGSPAHSSRPRSPTSFCGQYDLNHDGNVGKAEFTQVAAAKFKAEAHAGVLTPDGYFAIVGGPSRDALVKRYARLDTSHSGRLTLAQFSAPEVRSFERLDLNHDGVVTANELAAPRQRASGTKKSDGRQAG